MGIALAIIGIACIVYGVVVMMATSGTWFFAFWYVLGALLLVAAWFVVQGHWAALPTLARRIVSGVVVVLLAGFVCTQALILQDFNDEAEPGLDYIVVLGAQVRPWGPSTVLQYRLDAACDYLQQNESTKCIVSGGQGPNEHAAEAGIMAEYLLEHGVDESRIIIEADSKNTQQNIAFSSALFDPATDSVGIVTNNFHMYRALRIARKAGIKNVCGLSAGSVPLYVPNNMVRESLGLTKDFLVGNV